MFKSFKNSFKSTNKITEEIHNDFYTEVDKLLESALKSNSLETDKQGLIDKFDRLRELGFINTKEVKEAESEIQRIEMLRIENKSKSGIIEAINYFSLKYPQYKFITEDSVTSICKRYGLVYGEISKYKGSVPNLNLKKIEEFKINEEDECFLSDRIVYNPATGYIFSMSKIFRPFSFWKSKQEEDEIRQSLSIKNRSDALRSMNVRDLFIKCPLEIVAPQKDFDMTGMEVKGFKISKIPDPIVLKPVFFNNEKHYLIVTAWGIKSSDEVVVNQKMN